MSLQNVLHNLCLSVIQGANGLIKENKVPIKFCPQVEFVGTGFNFSQKMFPDLDAVLYHLLERSPDFKGLIEFIHDHKELEKYFFGWEQIQNVGHRIQPYQVVKTLLNLISWDMTNFPLKFPIFEAALFAEKILIEIRGYLKNFDADFREYSFKAGLKISKISSDEVNLILRNDWLNPDLDLLKTPFFLFNHFEFPRIVLEKQEETDKAKTPFDRFVVHEEWQKFIELMRSFQNCNVFISRFSESSLGCSIYQKRLSSHGYYKDIPGLTKKWTQSEISQFEDFVEATKRLSINGNQKNKFENAINWFSGRVFKHREQDKLLDMVIALESLFVGENSELSYKFCVRISKILEASREKRYPLFQLLKTAYNVRSKMVHMGLPPDKKHKVCDEEITLQELISRIEKIVIAAFKKIVDERGGFLKFDPEKWNRYILDEEFNEKGT